MDRLTARLDEMDDSLEQSEKALWRKRVAGRARSAGRPGKAGRRAAGD